MYSETGIYLDTFINSLGCDSIVTTNLSVEKTSENSFIANAFSPNGDGVNDCFGITYWKNVTELNFMIYNRWGNPVFTSSEIWDCWNGNYKGIPSDQGNYYYFIKAKTACGERTYKGDILLIR